MNQRLDEWIDNPNDEYYDGQFFSPYRSTVKFCDWLEELGLLDIRKPIKLIDIGTGKGANLF